ncbi:winged helix-turn-helix domain-containing protein [Ottowia sp.]|uniref:winged helix-turn-helix domain-containing tetratricopeptide repeat protein n=1 Tax=Ottowia sp. TaxID=1898956 RepID=UPI0025D18200|nr:winged helix-turn-helix domain-containing protein [Ottowia sp.]MBK6746334.1 winged helix-turn-helix domain-containing protein [Ottowia sp.]
MSDPLVFGRFELLLEQRRLLEHGAPVALGARAFDLLAVLVRHRDRVVSKDELLRLVWRDAAVEENNLSVQVSTLRKVLGADALRTVSGQGYRFTLPVSPPSGVAAADSMVLGLPDKPSIAVLPFANVGGVLDDAALIEGIGDELIDALSRVRSIFVISRHGVQAYQGRAVDPRTVARELGVRYVLEGSVRRSAGQVRIGAALIDALSGQQIWGERYDRRLDELFALQDETARAIVIAMAPHIERSEIERARGPRPQKDSAYALAQRAWAQAREGLSRSNRGARDAALALAREALAIDPRCSAAHNAIVDALSWHLYFDTATPPALDDALMAAAQALAIDSSDALAWRGRGWLMLVSGKLPQATADFRRSLELNPNDAITLVRLGMCEAVGGDPAGGLRQCLQALRLSPRDPARFHLLDNLIWAQFAAKAYDDGIDTARQSLREADFAGTRLCLVLCLVGAGDLARAASELRELKRLQPDMVAARLGGRWLASDPEVRRREADFLHAANCQAIA